MNDTHTRWKPVDAENPVLFDSQLAERLVARGYRFNYGQTMVELRDTLVGGCVNTGVSSWERIA